jgi:hypothetical protein
MQEKLGFYSVAATVMISVFGCAIQPKSVADNCPSKPQEIPQGYTKEECHCVKNPVQAAETSDPEWERRMGRKSPGTTTETTEGANGYKVTSAVHSMINSDYTVHCSKASLEPPAAHPTTTLLKLCGSDGRLDRCGDRE